jgi:hypothetical protein
VSHSIKWLVRRPILEPGTAEIRGRRATHSVVRSVEARDERDVKNTSRIKGISDNVKW